MNRVKRCCRQGLENLGFSLRIGIAIIVAIFYYVPAFAGHPMITDDTGTQGKEKYLLELNSGFVIEGQDTGSGMLAALTWGIANNIDLGIEFPYQWSPVKGKCDIPVEVKWRILDCDENGLSLALKPGFSIPSGDEKKGLGNGAVTAGLLVIVTKEWKHGAVHSNLGYTRDAYGLKSDSDVFRKDIWHASIATEINLTENLRSVFDAGIDTNSDKTSNVHPVYLIGGLIHSATENVDIDFGVKLGLNQPVSNTMFLCGLTMNL